MKEFRGVSKIQDLVYEILVKTVMKSPIIMVSPDLPMAELRQVLRDNHISGVPVAADSCLLGIVSVEDFIKWLSQGAPPCMVADRMSRNVLTVFSDESLIRAINHLERYGYGRLPVIERGSGKLIGIVTKGDIIKGILHELDIVYRQVEIQEYRASHLFKDIVADRLSLGLSYHISRGDIQQGGEVSSKLRQALKRLGMLPESIRRAAIAAYEAEMNVIIYAGEGDFNVTIDPERICIDVSDKGPGIPDIEKAMQPGFSSAPDWVRELGFGAGMGLPNIKRCSTHMAIQSTVGVGTTLQITIQAGAV